MVTRIVVWLLATFFLAGCSSVRFTSMKAPAVHATESTPPMWTSGYTPAVPESVVETLTYGRFTVNVTESGQEVVGGVFTPPASKPLASTQVHAIFVNYTTKELTYYRRSPAGIYEPVVGYAVMTPHPSILPKEVVRGKVLRIVEKPTWCPKVGGTVRQEHPDLPGCMPHGHPLNAMGDWRFDMAWDTPGWELNKLHGVEGYARGQFWTEKTHGCTRLMNDAIKNLITLLGPNAVKEGIEIVAFRGKVPQEKDEKQVVISAE